MLLFISTLLFLELADTSGNANVCHTECVLIRDCQAAFGLVSQRNGDIDQIERQLLQQTFCEFENSKPKVCCDTIKTVLHPSLKLLPSECGFIDGNRIYGGTTAGINEFPWMALISIVRKGGNQFACAGSLISSRYVLTAAHCVHNMEVAGVRVGDHDLRTNDDCERGSDGVVCSDPVQDIEVEEIIVHEDYIQAGKYWKHDIALLRLQTPIDPRRKNSRPVCLPISVDEQYRHLDGLKATVAGWGITEDGSEAQVLKKAEIPILPSDVCYLFFESKHVQERFRTKTESFFCAGVVGKDTCRRDSGGPLILSGKHGGFNRYIQYGITSFGLDKCGSDKPGLYTDVLSHLPWILDNMHS